LETYVIAVRREHRGEVQLSPDVVEERFGVHIKGAANPNLIVIEASPQVVELIRKELGNRVYIEPLILHKAL